MAEISKINMSGVDYDIRDKVLESKTDAEIANTNNKFVEIEETIDTIKGSVDDIKNKMLTFNYVQ